MRLKHYNLIAIAALILIFPLFCHAAVEEKASDWELLWQSNGKELPEPKKVMLMGAAWPDVDNQEWLTVSTKYHSLYFKPEMDLEKVTLIFQHLDNLYDFLARRSPKRRRTPIKTFLIPNQRARSVCSKDFNAMRTGFNGDVPLILTSLLHEETHLFNFEALEAPSQGWWEGEFSCLYFQLRARLFEEGKNIKRHISEKLSNGPSCTFEELYVKGRAAFPEAFAAVYFLEERYGSGKFDQLRKLLLQRKNNRQTKYQLLLKFLKVYGKSPIQLDREWRAFFGWEKRVEKGLLNAFKPADDAAKKKKQQTNTKKKRKKKKE